MKRFNMLSTYKLKGICKSRTIEDNSNSLWLTRRFAWNMSEYNSKRQLYITSE